MLETGDVDVNPNYARPAVEGPPSYAIREERTIATPDG
jgi:hypothetical protein